MNVEDFGIKRKWQRATNIKKSAAHKRWEKEIRPDDGVALRWLSDTPHLLSTSFNTWTLFQLEQILSFPSRNGGLIPDELCPPSAAITSSGRGYEMSQGVKNVEHLRLARDLLKYVQLTTDITNADTKRMARLFGQSDAREHVDKVMLQDSRTNKTKSPDVPLVVLKEKSLTLFLCLHLAALQGCRSSLSLVSEKELTSKTIRVIYKLSYWPFLCPFMVDDSSALCPSGATCWFAHGEDEIKLHPSIFRTTRCTRDNCSLQNNYFWQETSPPLDLKWYQKSYSCPNAHQSTHLRPAKFYYGGNLSNLLSWLMALQYRSSSWDATGRDQEVDLAPILNAVRRACPKLMYDAVIRWGGKVTVLHSLYKTVPCLRRNPHYVRECPYWHSAKDRRRIPFLYDPRTCGASYDPAFCPEGDSCRYDHSIVEGMWHPCMFRTTPCNDVFNCTFNDHCAFSHYPGEAERRLAALGGVKGRRQWLWMVSMPELEELYPSLKDIRYTSLCEAVVAGAQSNSFNREDSIWFDGESSSSVSQFEDALSEEFEEDDSLLLPGSISVSLNRNSSSMS